MDTLNTKTLKSTSRIYKIMSKVKYIPITFFIVSATYCSDRLTQVIPGARAVIKVSGHQHQWFPGVSQVVTM